MRNNKMRTITCNRCGFTDHFVVKQDHGGRGLVTINPPGWSINISRVMLTMQSIDLCKDCTTDLYEWIEKGKEKKEPIEQISGGTELHDNEHNSKEKVRSL